jgi:hypothetical protein
LQVHVKLRAYSVSLCLVLCKAREAAHAHTQEWNPRWVMAWMLA